MSIFDDAGITRREGWLLIIAALLIAAFFGLAIGDYIIVPTGG